MLTKKILSWDFATRNELAIFLGYYDTGQYWATIKECYVEQQGLEIVLRAISGQCSCTLKREWCAGGLHVTTPERTFTIYPKVIIVGDVYINTFQLVAVDLCIAPFFSCDCLLDDRMFYFDDVYRAILHGLQEGIVAGADGLTSIDGLSPEEYAWKYTEEQRGL
jgi:hypothetical protein